MKEKVYARLNFWDNKLLDHLNLGISFLQIHQSGSPKEVKLDKNAKDPIAQARNEIKRTSQLLYCNSAYVKQSGFTQEKLLAAPDTALLRKRVMPLEMMKVLWNNLCQDLPWSGITSWKRPDGRQSIVEFSVLPFSYGEEHYTLGITHDVTHQSWSQFQKRHNWLAETYDAVAPMALIGMALVSHIVQCLSLQDTKPKERLDQ